MSSHASGSRTNATFVNAKQGPTNVITNYTVYNYSDTPAENKIAKRPDYVIVNGDASGGTYMFKYEASGSIGATIPPNADNTQDGGWLTGSVHPGEGGAEKYDINPIGWRRVGGHASGGVGSTGEVTFVYSGKDK